MADDVTRFAVRDLTVSVNADRRQLIVESVTCGGDTIRPHIEMTLVPDSTEFKALRRQLAQALVDLEDVIPE